MHDVDNFQNEFKNKIEYRISRIHAMSPMHKYYHGVCTLHE